MIILSRKKEENKVYKFIKECKEGYSISEEDIERIDCYSENSEVGG